MKQLISGNQKHMASDSKKSHKCKSNSDSETENEIEFSKVRSLDIENPEMQQRFTQLIAGNQQHCEHDSKKSETSNSNSDSEKEVEFSTVRSLEGNTAA